MRRKYKVGILKETKIPVDKRAPFSPQQIINIQHHYPEIEIVVQSSYIRCFTDEEYIESDIVVKDDISDCDMFFGVKEVNAGSLIPDKTYFFFSHTAKEQPYNQHLLREVLKKRITLVDYEYLTDENDIRIVAFGYWAGIVGAYNAIKGIGMRYNLFDLKPAYRCKDYNEIKDILNGIKLPDIKILITGEGRVATGAEEILQLLKIRKISSVDYLKNKFNEPVYCKIGPQDYVKHKKGREFNFNEFIAHPESFISDFKKFNSITDLYMACHYWDPKAPSIISKKDIQNSKFNISIIADISCDINGPITSTIRSSTIEKPFYWYDKKHHCETEALNSNSILVMAVDHLPGEIPRDASIDFGSKLMKNIVPLISKHDKSRILNNATISKNGLLTEKFNYLNDFAEGKE